MSAVAYVENLGHNSKKEAATVLDKNLSANSMTAKRFLTLSAPDRIALVLYPKILLFEASKARSASIVSQLVQQFCNGTLPTTLCLKLLQYRKLMRELINEKALGLYASTVRRHATSKGGRHTKQMMRLRSEISNL